MVIVGGGVIGLSLAYELSGRGMTATLIERGELAREASWAGAGILLPGDPEAESQPPLERLRGLSDRLLETWSAALFGETGIDNGYRRSGGLHVALTEPERAALEEEAAHWRRCGIEVEAISPAELEPALSSEIALGYHLPREAQLRPPRHTRALADACRRRRVAIRTHTLVRGFDTVGSRVVAALTPEGPVAGGAFVLAAGPWTGGLTGELGAPLATPPVKGQIVLLSAPRPPLDRIVWNGLSYLLPRPDGRLLVGATMEDAGFDTRPTAEGVRSLLAFGRRLLPALGDLELEGAWAGLRPGSRDGLPYLGRLPSHDNLWTATGHLRSGFELSAGTARVMTRLLLGETPDVPVEAFRPDRP